MKRAIDRSHGLAGDLRCTSGEDHSDKAQEQPDGERNIAQVPSICRFGIPGFMGLAWSHRTGRSKAADAAISSAATPAIHQTYPSKTDHFMGSDLPFVVPFTEWIALVRDGIASRYLRGRPRRGSASSPVDAGWGRLTGFSEPARTARRSLRPSVIVLFVSRSS